MAHAGTLFDDAFFPLQDHGYFRRFAALHQRAVPFGARVTDRLVRPGQLGHYVLERETWGDAIGPYHWQAVARKDPAAGKRAGLGLLNAPPGLGGVLAGAVGLAADVLQRRVGAWSSAWPAVVQGGTVPGGGASAGIPPSMAAARQALQGVGLAAGVVGAQGIRFGFAGQQAGQQFGIRPGAAPGNVGLQAGQQFGLRGNPLGAFGVQGAGAAFGVPGNLMGPFGVQGAAPGRAGPGASPAHTTGGQGPRPPATVSLLPVHSDAWDADGRFETRQARLADDRRLAPGTVGIVLDSVREVRQDTLFFPCDSRLVAVNAAGDPAGASLVYDLDAKDRPDPARRARLHSAFRVARPAVGGKAKFLGENAIAWQLGRAGQDALEGLGLCADHSERALEPLLDDLAAPGLAAAAAGAFLQAAGGAAAFGAAGVPGAMALGVGAGLAGVGAPANATGTGATATYAAFGAGARGPLEVGDRKDKHAVGTTQDGEKILAGHLSTDALHRGHGGDGPLDFERRRYSDPGKLPFQARVHLRYDQAKPYKFFDEDLAGVWRWEAETFFTFPRREPPTTKPPPPTLRPPPPTIETPPGRTPERRPPGEGPGPQRVTTPRGIHDPAPPRGASPLLPSVGPLFGRRTRRDPVERPLLGVIPLGFPAWLAQAAHTFPFDVPDLRRWAELGADDDLAADATRRAWLAWRLGRTPISGRIEAFCRVTPNTGEPRYTHRPGAGRYPGGTASGGWIVMPAELGVEDYVAPGASDGTVQLSETCVVFATGAVLAFGTPTVTSASECVTPGWEITIGATGQDLVVTRATGTTGSLLLAGRALNTEGVTVTSVAYTTTNNDRTLFCDGDAAGGNIAITFVTAGAANDGVPLTIKNIGTPLGARDVTYTSFDSLGVSSVKTLVPGASGYVASDGSVWYTV